MLRFNHIRGLREAIFLCRLRIVAWLYRLDGACMSLPFCVLVGLRTLGGGAGILTSPATWCGLAGLMPLALRLSLPPVLHLLKQHSPAELPPPSVILGD